jgi:hypothetical protein
VRLAARQKQWLNAVVPSKLMWRARWRRSDWYDGFSDT